MGFFDDLFGSPGTDILERAQEEHDLLMESTIGRIRAGTRRAQAPLKRQVSTLRTLMDFEDPLETAGTLQGAREQASGTVRQQERAGGLTGAERVRMGRAIERTLATSITGLQSARLRREVQMNQLIQQLLLESGRIEARGAEVEAQTISAGAGQRLRASAQLAAQQKNPFAAILGAGLTAFLGSEAGIALLFGDAKDASGEGSGGGGGEGGGG